jgi:2-polyprenyl-3-methyl-5-hydroxy-6-metoxy-1,4-benzoquinol methylase
MKYRQQLFKNVFIKHEVEEYVTKYSQINPDRPFESTDILYKDTEPLFRSFIKETPEIVSFVDQYLPQLGMFLQGPFPLPGNRVTKSAWDCRAKFNGYKGCGFVEASVRGRRVLDIGCNAGYDSFYFSGLGAFEVVGLEPWVHYYHSMFLSAVYDRPGVSFHKLGWEDVDRRYFGSFDIVICNGLIYHIKNPLHLLDKIASVMKPGSQLLMETHVLSESSGHAHFIENSFWGDETYWWIFGDECLMGMLRASGFKDIQMGLKMKCDSRNPDNPNVTKEGIPAGARAWFTAIKK